MDTPQSKAFWLGRNLQIMWFALAVGKNPQEQTLTVLKRSIDGFARSLDLQVDVPPPAEILKSVGSLREGIRMDLAIARTQFVANCYVFGFDFTSWANFRGGYGQDNPVESTVDLAKVEATLRTEASELGLLPELEQSIAVAKDPAVTSEQFKKVIGTDMVLKMSAKLNATTGPPTSNRLFIVMPMDPEDQRLPEVLDSIQQAGKTLGLEAFRADELASPGRITDNIVQSLKSAAFVVVDLTHSRSNVYWEAGYTHGLGKIPIYVARKGTDLAFDIKDYPVIYFANVVELREKLVVRLKGMMTGP